MLRTLLSMALVLVVVPHDAEARPPNRSRKARLAAIGKTAKLPVALRRALEPGDDFDPLPKPGPGDWLAWHKTWPQSFTTYRRKHGRVKGRRRFIYVQPIGDFPPGDSPPLSVLADYVAMFFGREVKLREPVEMRVRSRIHPGTGKRQLLAGAILYRLAKQRPRDAYAILGVTMTDLYPRSNWNFVYGLAWGRKGVFSLARHDPAFHGEPRPPDFRQLMLRRSLRTMTHELAHMFGVTHCVFYQCLVAGSNGREESDSHPLHLCPVCLRKLQYALGFDVVDRYRQLAAFYRHHGLTPEAAWVERRLKHIAGGKRSTPDAAVNPSRAGR